MISASETRGSSSGLGTKSSRAIGYSLFPEKAQVAELEARQILARDNLGLAEEEPLEKRVPALPRQAVVFVCLDLLGQQLYIVLAEKCHVFLHCGTIQGVYVELDDVGQLQERPQVVVVDEVIQRDGISLCRQVAHRLQ